MKKNDESKQTLYLWQEQCLEIWINNQGRGMVQAVTGSGKTLLALKAAERLGQICDRTLKVKIVVPTAALMRQWRQVLKTQLADIEEYQLFPEKLEQDIGMCGGGYQGNHNCKYMIYVINSARYRLAREILKELRDGQAVFLIADECHRYDSAENRLIFEFLPHIDSCEKNFYSMGLSATLPTGERKQYLSSVLGKQIYSYGMKDAKEMDTICRYDIFHIGIIFSENEEEEYNDLTEQMQRIYTWLAGKKLVPVSCSKGELFESLRLLTKSKDIITAKKAASYITLAHRRQTLVCLAEARIPCAVNLIEKLGIRERIIIFGERIRQAEDLYRRLQERYPGRVGRYHSKMGSQANKNTLERFRDGELQILVACKAIDEGLDVPDVSVGIILSGTSVQRQRIQRLGRIVRKADGKKGALLYYLHLQNSSEEQIFLPGEEDKELFELEYCSKRERFFQEEYEKRAEELLNHMTAEGADEKVISEVRGILEKGIVRGDWKNNSEEYYDEKVKAAGNIRERNYWMCMRKLSEV